VTASRQTKRALRKAEKRRRRQVSSGAQLSLITAATEQTTTVIPRSNLITPSHFWIRALLYLIALALAEIVTVLIDIRWGVIGHAVILAFLISQGAVDAYAAGRPGFGGRSIERRQANFLTALALVPLIRIVSLAMPLAKFPELTWYGLIAMPLLAAAWTVIRTCGYRRRELGLSIDWRPIPVVVTAIVGLSGIGLGYLEYRILHPDPLIDNLTLLRVLAVSAILMIGTGLTEELIFRGVLQRAVSDLFGDATGIVYSSACFAVLHIGHRSLLDIGFVFGTALLFGLIVRQTRSLAGVTIAHGLTNICLFILFPHLLHAAGSL
jgi:membrane protease YdiL (CAAX protease family)